MQEAGKVMLSFNFDFDERTEWEIQQKGWLEQATVHLHDGSSLPVCFWDPVRLAQDLETDLKSGRSCIAEPVMIVIPRLTVENMKAAVEELCQRGYFDELKSLFK